MNLLDTINIDDLLPDLLLPSPRTLLTAEDIQRLDAIQIAHDQSNESGECWIHSSLTEYRPRSIALQCPSMISDTI